MNDYVSLILQLERVAESIDEMSLVQLREDLAHGHTKSGVDRDLMRARRAVEKASGILRQLNQVSESPEET